jgi:hypothetical protein
MERAFVARTYKFSSLNDIQPQYSPTIFLTVDDTLCAGRKTMRVAAFYAKTIWHRLTKPKQFGIKVHHHLG